MRENKIVWLQILQGWSMLLVVIGHITLTGIFTNPTTPFSAAIERIVYSFHMPLFMFVSGWLYYFTRLSRDKSFTETIVDKLKRLGIPFLFFTLLTILPKVALGSMMKHPVHFTYQYFVNVFFLLKENPLGEMWFVVSLLVLMLLFVVYKVALKSKVGTILLFIVAIGIYYAFPRSIYVWQLNHVADMMIFFYGGILFCRFGWQRFFESKVSLAIMFLVFVFLNTLNTPPIFLKCIGILFSLSLCMNVSKIFPSLLSSFRNYTFQIFLMGIFFQMGVRYIYGYYCIDALYWPLYIVSILVGLFIPVLIAKFIQRLDNKYLSLCFGL
jgi:fucose 4-O-acetylase-like acetyltransferase